MEMDEHTQPSPGRNMGEPTEPYEPPELTDLGTVAELTQKTTGAADGSTFLGLDIGT